MSIVSPLSAVLSIAPMIDWTYTHFRVLLRLLAPHALLYTDMQTYGAIKHAPHKSLEFHSSENPLALQLGGSNPDELVYCAMKGEAAGFNEINLNLGCPSDRVQAGRFGACLMVEPELVSKCIAAMKQAVSIPVTVKTRIGIDKEDSYDFFSDFIRHLADAGADKLVVHARKAWLKGLNPKQNRTIPPINYEYVYRIKQELKIPVVINGHINHLEEIRQHLMKVDGVMLGRLACQNPYEIAKIHHGLFPEYSLISRSEVGQQYFSYIHEQYQSASLSLLVKPFLGMAHGLPGAKKWKNDLLQAQRNNKIDELHQVISRLAEMEAQDELLAV